jgi:predicted dehydrogenase
MQSAAGRAEGPIGVGAVATPPAEDGGLLAQLPNGGAFELVAFSDEALDEEVRTEDPVRYYADYNVLLQDPDVEVVLVEGPVDVRRDLAVRALSAGRHVVIASPFAETAADGHRILKTALRAGRLATMDMPWRDAPALGAARAALAGENAATIHGIAGYHGYEPPAEPPGAEGGALEAIGLAVLDQAHVLLPQDVKTVSAHVVGSSAQVAGAGAAGGGFLIYMPLRSGGWAIAQAGRETDPPLPTWVIHIPGGVITVQGGRAIASTSTGRRTYEAPPATEGFWENLRRVVREGAEPKCHPADIVRAMKLHEAALLSAADGDAVAI